MKIEFKFNSKSSGQNVPEAIMIAERCGGEIENNFYKIVFGSPEDENLLKLYALVGNLKGSTISINGEEAINPRKLFLTVNCPDKFLCKGICKHFRVYYSTIDTFGEDHAETLENNVLSVKDEEIIRRLTNFLISSGVNRFKFNKDALIEKFIEDTQIESKFCDKYDLSATNEILNEFPEEIVLLTPEEYAEKFEEPEELEIDHTINVLLSLCKIAEDLPFDEILRCSQIISFVRDSGHGIPIENTNILIYSIPSSQKVIFLKFILEENEMVTEENQDEYRPVIKKKDDFYFFSAPGFEVYFHMFNETDPALRDNFIKLKSIT